jgi:hypothetical protein
MPILNNQVSPSAIAFIDTQLENYQSLIAGVKSGTEVVVLDGNKDAIDQITEILGARSNIDSIHIISHGSPGSLQLGDGSLSLDDIECDRDSLQQWFSPQTDSLGKIGWSICARKSLRFAPTIFEAANLKSSICSTLKFLLSF